MKKRIILAIAAVLFFASFTYAKKDKDAYEALKPLMEVYAIIQDSYVDEDKANPDDLVKGAIKGMVQTLDPFSQYMDPQAYKDMSDDTKAEFGGLGIEIGIKDGFLTVISPIEDTPAFTAGIQAGDRILFIDGETTDGIEIMDAVHKMRGEIGTKVTITVQRGHEPATKDYTITRAVIKVQTVRYNTVGDTVGYIKINEFMGKGSETVKAALDEFREKKIKKLVIDLRNNPGGLLDEAVKIADLFLPKDKLIVYTAGRDKEKVMNFKSEGGMQFKGDIVVIINEGSASASEILAGALQDNKRAVIIGSQSFGKGSVQTIIPLSDKSALRITTAQYFVPSGKKIHGIGIKPDIEMKEPIPSTYSVGLSDKGYISDFAVEFLKKHPKGLEGNKEKESNKVSESDIKNIIKKSFDDTIMEEFAKFLKQKDQTIQIQELAGDRDTILKWIKTEVADRQKGKAASRAVAVENDIQIKRAIDVLDTMSKLEK
jgi:carboxyl-terminal processing protease